MLSAATSTADASAAAGAPGCSGRPGISGAATGAPTSTIGRGAAPGTGTLRAGRAAMIVSGVSRAGSGCAAGRDGAAEATAAEGVGADDSACPRLPLPNSALNRPPPDPPPRSEPESALAIWTVAPEARRDL